MAVREMVTTATSTEQVVKRGTRVGGGPPGKNGPGKNGSNGKGDRGKRDDGPSPLSPSSYRIAIWIGLASISMLFMGLTGAYVFLAFSSEAWKPLKLPHALWGSTALILASSGSLEFARGSLKEGERQSFRRWLLFTLLLGLGFVACQLFVWKRFVAQGIYLATNQHSAFFYLMTGIHGVHLLGGILALSILTLKFGRRLSENQQSEKRREAITSAVSLYWHFMGGIWIYLFLLLSLWG